MTPREVAALLAYAVRLDPRLTLDDPGATADRLEAWCDLLSDVPGTAPGGWDASRTVRDHIARSPWRIQASDVSRPWWAHRTAAIRGATHTFEPYDHPEIDPDDGDAYVAALRADRDAIATGQHAPLTVREITSTGPAALEAEHRRRVLGTYSVRSVDDELRQYRPDRARREALAAAGLPDVLAVPCPDPYCRARPRRPCTGTRRRVRSEPHAARTEAALAAHTTTTEETPR
ncbi:zinc finger domain-containing protein [Streptomyces sp. LE64]|uniref:zinc finger domain-containing protein n=1 Tax=Streptomyces sp. LE64 TaxID=3448653 RepID=UPI004043929C